MGFLDQKGYNNQISNAAELKFVSAMSGKKVSFYAYITSYTENYASDWNIQAVYGRTDPIANFRGNTRNLTLAWDVPAATADEAKENLKNFDALNQMLYPYYSKSGGTVDEEDTATYSSNALSLAKSPLMRVKFANLIQAGNKSTKGLLGYITSLSWNPVIEMGMFTDAGQLFPKVVSLNVNFGVLHEYDRGEFAKSKVKKDAADALGEGEAEEDPTNAEGGSSDAAEPYLEEETPETE